MSLQRRSKLMRFRRDQRGVTIVEFGLIAPVLILMIMGIVEIGLMMAGQHILDNAAFAASRTGKTGYAASGSTQEKTVLAAVQKASSDYLDPAKIVISTTAYSDYDSMQPEPFADLNKNGVRDAAEPFDDINKNGVYDKNVGATGLGASGQIVSYTATYNWRLFTPLMGRFVGKDGIVPLKSLIVVKNEPY